MAAFSPAGMEARNQLKSNGNASTVMSEPAMSAKGHEDAFHAVRPNSRCRIRKRSIAAGD